MDQNPQPASRRGIDWERAQTLLQSERAAFISRNPRSGALAQRAGRHLMFGVPLHWMNDWGTPFALQMVQASGAQLLDADGHCLSDFCLGDTGAMFGHSPTAVARAVARQVAHGITAMLASEDATVVGELLSERFGLPYWQFAMTASDANRFVLRWLRAASGRRKLIVFNGCYHGTVDDVFVTAPWTMSSSIWRVAGRRSAPACWARCTTLRRTPWCWSSTTSRRWRRHSARVTSPACWPSRP